MAEKILIIDDDLDTLKLVGMMLQKLGYQHVFNLGSYGQAEKVVGGQAGGGRGDRGADAGQKAP